MSSFWHWYIWIIAISSILALFWLIQATRKVAEPENDDDKMGHTFDGIEEYNKPLPAWWLYMFWFTMIYGIGYYAYYGLGNWNGLANWSSSGQLAEEQKQHEAKFGATFAKYASMSLEELTSDKTAIRMGKQMFENNCALCHGTNAAGGYGFPNLTDNDWLYGGSAEAILASVGNGRRGQMPAWGDALGADNVEAVSQYVLNLSGQSHEAELAEKGKSIFMVSCAACHNPDGTGNVFIGAPNLTDNIWLYDNPQMSLADDIRQSISSGRAGNMPAWSERLGEAKVNIISGYVYSLSN